MPRAGLEPAREKSQLILSQPCLPSSSTRAKPRTQNKILCAGRKNKYGSDLEAWAGIAPTYNGFADRCLAAWLPGRQIILTIYYLVINP